MKKIQPELKRIHSPDVFDLENPGLSEDRPYRILVQAMFGPWGTEGEESFDVVVCNALWLADQVRSGPIPGRHHLFVNRFDIGEIRAFWSQLATECAGGTWEEVAEKLGRFGKWEFEDYKE